MKIGIISVNLKFFGEIASELYKKHSVQLYEETGDNSLNAYNLGKLCNWADLIFCEFAQVPFQFALNFAPKKKIIVRLHRIEVYNSYIYSLNWSVVDMLIFPAQHIKDIFYQRLAAAKCLNIDNKPRNDIIIPNTVNHKHFQFVQRDFSPPWNICIVGRIIELKRIYDFIQWFQDIDERFRLNIVTQEVNWSSSYGSNVKELAKSDDRITFVPEKDKQSLGKFMQSQDIIISHSHEESFHLSVMEAMATGAYPLIAGWKGADAIYPSKYIYHSPKAFYSKIETWANLDSIQKLGASIEAYEYTKPYDSIEWTIKIRELVEAVYNRDNTADYYDSMVPHMIEQKDNARNKDVLKFLDKWITPGMKVLDLGCGIGITTEHIHQIGADVIGLDLSPKAIEYARNHSKANFRCGSIFFERFYYKFDYVVMADVLEHVALDQHLKLFTLLNGLTTNSGMLIINTPHPDYMKKYPFRSPKLFQPVNTVVEIEPLIERLKEAGFSKIEYSKSAFEGQYHTIVAKKRQTNTTHEIIKEVQGTFPGSGKYWEERYNSGGASGAGSYGKLAEFKAEIINSFVEDNKIKSVIDFGCGDGNQLSLFRFPNYMGLDVSRTAIKLCTKRFKNDRTKGFFVYDPECFENKNPAELALSLDVIPHLVEDNIFERYMKHLFSSSDKFVVIYSSNIDTDQRFHEKHREFTKWIKINLPEWELIKETKNKYPDESRANFFVYKREQKQ